MSLKWLKYAFKRQVIGTFPGLYWGARGMARGLLEPEIALLRHLCRPDKISIDIGANWGAYAHVAAKFSAHVHCFEPQPALARVLQRGLGRLANVTIHNVALSNASGWAEMRIPTNDIGYSTIEPSNRLEDKADLTRGVEVVRVRTERLDELSVGSMGFVKIDVEGHEIEALEGSMASLARDKPSLIIEVEERHRSGSVTAVVGMLSKLDYNCFVLTSGKLAPVDVSKDGSPSSHRNLVFLHPETQSALPADLFA
jgi:FkbM family methyltransferase